MRYPIWVRLAAVAVSLAGVAGMAIALWHERFGLALLCTAFAIFVAWIASRKARDEAAANEPAQRPAATQARPPAGAPAFGPAASRTSETTLTLWAASEQIARQLMDDRYFLLGGLMTDPGEAAARFREALDKGGTISGQVTPNLTKGGYDVRLRVVPAAPAKAAAAKAAPAKTAPARSAPGACPYCGAVLTRDGGGARINLGMSKSRPGEQGFFCPECGHELEQADRAKIRGGAAAPAPPPPAVPGAYTGPPIADLTQEDVIEELVKAGVDRKRAELEVQVNIVGASGLDAAEIRAIQFSDQPLTVKDLAMRWAVHCIYHGGKPRTA